MERPPDATGQASPGDGHEAAGARPPHVPRPEPPAVWPPWFAFAGFGAALMGTVIAVVILAAVFGVEESDTPVLIVVGTLIQGVFFVGAALALSRSVAPPRAWQFGLRRAPLGSSIGWAVAGMLSFYVLGALYVLLVDPSADQDVTESLGAEDGTFGLIVACVMVIVVAPVVEEVFFRGFFYRALRSRYPIALAAVVNGVVFGLIHFDFESAEGLLLVPPLGALGLIFCLVYERTGTLYSVIGMHAFNNMVAFAAQTGDGWRAAVIVGPLMLVAVAVIPALLPSGPRPLPVERTPADPYPQLSLPVE